MWSWNYKLQNWYVKTLVVRTVSLFSSLKLDAIMLPVLKFKCSSQQNRVYDVETRLRGTLKETTEICLRDGIFL